MHVHTPKAVHSLRAFAIEIGTITLGILIALGLEAGVEAWHNHEVVAHARADLRQELDANREALARSLASERTVLRTLDRFGEYFRAHLAGRDEALPVTDLSIRAEAMGTAAWEATVATQALTHMPIGEAQALARAYSATRSYNDLEDNARRSWFELSTAFVSDPAKLSPEEMHQALHDLALSYSYMRSSIIAGDKLLQTYGRTAAALG